jgi:hypothetical protein
MKMHDGKELTLTLVLCQKVAGFIPDEALDFFFNLPNPSSSTMDMGLTQPLTEMSTRHFPEG